MLKVNGKSPNPSTVWRWITVGVRARSSGELVKLAPRKIGGVNTVTPAAVRAFLEAVNIPQSLAGAATVGQVRRQHSQAAKDLDDSLGAI